jgi:hypothetical protein
MDSKLADKPKYLTYKDLKKDSGKGFYHWMRPYDRFQSKPSKPDNVLPPRLPRAFVLRFVMDKINVLLGSFLIYNSQQISNYFKAKMCCYGTLPWTVWVIHRGIN